MVFPVAEWMKLLLIQPCREVKGQIREGNRTEISMPENGRNRDGCSPNIAGVTRKLVRNDLHPRILAAN